MSAPIILDVSRLLSRAARPVPTGIDRVEHAYAEGLRTAVPDRLRYAAVHPLGLFSHLPTARTRSFVERLGQEWLHAMPTDEEPGQARTMARRLQTGMMLPRTNPRFLAGRQGRPAYLLTSHHHLHQPDLIEAAKRKLQAAFVCLIQDTIPTDYPEFSRPFEGVKHRKRIETAARFADALIFGSESTREAVLPYMKAAGRSVPMLVAPFGVGAYTRSAAPAPALDRPYFVCIGTIEPRKNHLLLLHIWRRLATEMGPRTPRLVIIGQRGWEIEMVVDILERSELLRDHIVEHNALPDATVRSLLAGARALLMPSYAEGYGLPIIEALALGTPVLCSDIPPFREAGGAAPEYFDPLDGVGWAQALRDYTADSPRRQAALARSAQWSPHPWPQHLDAVIDLVDRLGQGA